MSDLTPETLAELRRRHAALTPFALRFLSGGPGGEPFIALACEDGTPLPEPAFDAVLLFAKLAAAALPALLDAAAERDRLAAKLGAVREWIDRRGVDVGDRDDDYMRGYRDAQRHALLDAAELRRALDAETGGES